MATSNLKKEMEDYFFNYNNWAQRIRCQCQKQVPEAKWYVRLMTIDRMFDGWDDGIPIFHIQVHADNGYHKKFAMAADFLDRSWDEIMKYLAEEGRTLVEAVKEIE